MVRLHETLDTRLPIGSAFAFVADFSNAQSWDPGVAWSKAVGNGAVEIGSTYELGVRMAGRVAPMEYSVILLEPNRRVVLEGSGSNVSATDDIRFEATPDGTRIDYAADIQLLGWLRLIQPFTGRAFANVARNARDGMQRALDELAARAPASETTERAGSGQSEGRAA